MIRFEECFHGIIALEQAQDKEFVFIPHANQRPSRQGEEQAIDMRIFARYKDTRETTFKRDLGALIHQDLEHGEDWRWHHIVEHTHLKKLYPEPEAQFLYDYQIPTALIHQKTEHKDYNLFHAFGANLVFNLPKENTVLRGKERSHFLFSLKNLYSQVYSHDTLFKAIAINIIERL